MIGIIRRGHRNDLRAADDPSIAFLDENWGRPGTKRSPAISIIEGEYRYVEGKDHAGKPSSILLSTHDRQIRDLSEAQPGLTARLRAMANRQLEETAAFELEIYKLDEMQLDQLRALGCQLP